MLDIRIIGAAVVAPATLLLASPACAAGGAHVIDDATVETPGVCHLESWVTRYGPGRDLVNLSPACTAQAWPALEIGAPVQHLGSAEDTETTLGPALKLNLRSESTGLGLGLIGAGAWSLRSGRLETAGLTAPATLALARGVRVNLNFGWSYSRAGAVRNAVVYGGQVEVQATPDLVLMVEGFRRGHGPAGGQAGVRWTPGGGRMDLDLLVGERIDGSSPRAVTLGLTVRR